MEIMGIIGLVLLASILLVEIFNWRRNASIGRKLDRIEGMTRKHTGFSGE